MDTLITNDARRQSARQALADFALGEPYSGDIAEDRDADLANATDLVTNVLHLLGEELGPEVPEQVLDRAFRHWVSERGPSKLERDLYGLT